MEIIIRFTVEDIDLAIDYYVDSLNQFRLLTKDDDSAKLSYKQNSKIVLRLRLLGKKGPSDYVSLQVSNSEKLFEYIKSKQLEECGIIKDAYKFKDESITFLTGPPGNYFYTKDPFGNRIQFYDKYEERIP